MTFSTSFIKKFSWFTIIVAILYIIGEGYFMFLYGQPHLHTLADLIAVLLLFFGGIMTLKYNNLGIICGAWGYSFCINYRTWVWRYYAKIEGVSDASTDNVGNILFFLLLFSFIAFLISILLNLPKTKIK
ncbi:hypothetical protein H3Z83_01200 [Tenacibaculum sp. S7007]|uniref:Uncharacterized protein n=1 Tax=Tenacibaculum pelagium TaxID=2759527 RepID=A0A839AJ12_9FLAO|nr:hypothetical protein [Tenacibaculum pelagium]MBA6155142.1 hypothetical protein [Tenacibaculum pelagium]